MILARSAGVDVIIGGHDEHLLAFYDGKVALTESESQANYVVITELAVTKITKDGKSTVTWSPNFRIIDTATVQPDAEIAAIVKGYEDKLSKELDIAIGVTETPLDSRRAHRARQRGRHRQPHRRCAARRRSAPTSRSPTAAASAPTSNTRPAQTLTRRDVLSEMPFGNTTVLIEVTGDKVKAALENGVSQVRELGGRFPQVSGIDGRGRPEGAARQPHQVDPGQRPAARPGQDLQGRDERLHGPRRRWLPLLRGQRSRSSTSRQASSWRAR